MALIECPEADLGDLLDAAAQLRDRGKGRDVTHSRKVFLPVTNLCRDRCTYCTFRKDPGDPGAWTMMPVARMINGTPRSQSPVTFSVKW